MTATSRERVPSRATAGHDGGDPAGSSNTGGAGLVARIPTREAQTMASRRDLLKGAGGALLAASAVSASAQVAEAAAGQEHQQEAYGHGMVWNTALPGVAGELLLSFDIRANLTTGKGFGTCSDSVHPQANLQFSIAATAKHGNKFTMQGTVIRANDPAHVGQPVQIAGELQGTATTVTITIGGLAFHGSGLLVVIAIIAILIG
jgi:hypothetical protein